MMLELKSDFQPWECPLCGKPVGYLGRGIASLVGVGFHGCDFSNVKHPDHTVEAGADG